MSVVSWSDAYQRREREALLACARSVDRLNATLCKQSLTWGLAPDNIELFPKAAHRATIGPVEMQLRLQLGLIDDKAEELRTLPARATEQ